MRRLTTAGCIRFGFMLLFSCYLLTSITFIILSAKCSVSSEKYKRVLLRDAPSLSDKLSEWPFWMHTFS